MRCNECNVDLGEEYTVCPLCGTKAVDDAPHLEGIKTAAYPKYENAAKKEKYGYNFPMKFLLRISMAVCALLGVISIFTTEKVWIYGVAALVLLNTAVYFVSGLLEKKGKLLHSLVALLATAAFSLVTVIISAIAGCGLIQSARVFAVCAVFVLLLCVIRRKRAGAQLRAFFSL